MQVSEPALKNAYEAARKRFWEVFCRGKETERGREYDEPSIDAAVDAALATLQPEPVPGAAVCTLEQARGIAGEICAGWGINYPPRDAAEQLRDFINAELGPAPAESAPRFHVTREELADELLDAWQHGPKQRPACWLAVADKAIELLARRPATDEADQLRSELALSERNAREWEAREAAATAEPEKTRAELEACQRHRDLFRKHQLRAEAAHEALRAACAMESTELAALDGARRGTNQSCNGVFVRYADRIQATLLKPAPAEAEPKRSAWDDFAEGIDADIQAACSPIQHPPPESAMVEPLRAELDALWVFVRGVSALRGPLRNGCSTERFCDEADRALDARKGG